MKPGDSLLLNGDANVGLSIGQRLQLEIAIMAGRLAVMLDESFPGDANALSDGRAFLHGSFSVASSDKPLAEWDRSASSRRPSMPHPLDRLIEGLGLGASEAAILILTALPEEHEGYAAVLRGLHPRHEPCITIGLAAQLLFPHPGQRSELRRMLTTSGRLIGGGAVRVSADGAFFERSLQLADGLWSALYGLEVWPAGIEPIRVRHNSAGLEEWLARPGCLRAMAALKQRQSCTILVNGDSEDASIWRGLALVKGAGLEPAALTWGASATPDARRAIQAHALARGAVPVLRMADAEPPAMAAIPDFADYTGPVLLCVRSGTAVARSGRPLLSVAGEVMTTEARRRMWQEQAPSLADQAPYLAARYPVAPHIASELAKDLELVERIEKRMPTVEDLTSSLRARSGSAVSSSVELIRPDASWKDLVLPLGKLSQLQDAVGRLLLQSRVLDEWGFLKGRIGARGVRMLFSGPPGTGKTLSAEVMANALGVDLMVVDLSKVVSKWIGETEKNLASVFDNAEHAQAVVFFDEADALFGKRTEVSDAHDRYANLETAYLLQRLERFEGLAILATNLRQNIDVAFSRRLEFSIDFEEPDRELRYQLWRRHIPEAAPLADDVNLQELAALYPVVGALIRNATVAGAFLAAAENSPITRLHMVRAVRREYEKAGRAFPGAPAGITI